MTGAAGAAARLAVVDTCDELPGLLPAHAWEALQGAEVVLRAPGAHPGADALQASGVGVEPVDPAGHPGR